MKRSEKREKKWTDKELGHLMRLRDCVKTTDMGMTDCGFPKAMAEMASYGWVEPVGQGYQVTALGREYLALNAKFIK